MEKETIIRDFSGRITRKITTQSNGDKVVREFSGRILGRYDSNQDVTRDFYGRIIAKGDASSGL